MMFSPVVRNLLLSGWAIAALLGLDPALGRAAEKEPDLARAVSLIVTGTNQFRTDEGRSTLKVNEALTKASQYFAEYMARTGKFSHTADDSQPWERATKHGYDYCLVLENIAYQYSSVGFATEELAKRFVQGWKDSPGHRKNMLDRDVTEIGVAIAPSSEAGRYYAVQLFGRPKSAEIVFRVSNRSSAAVEYTVDGKAQTIEPRYTITHRVCRPPEVRITGLDSDRPLRPESGTLYVLRRDANGTVTVTTER